MLTNGNNTTKHKKAPPLLHGRGNLKSSRLAADVDLVAFGVAKNARAEDLEAYLKENGLDVKEVVCLTR